MLRRPPRPFWHGVRNDFQRVPRLVLQVFLYAFGAEGLSPLSAPNPSPVCLTSTARCYRSMVIVSSLHIFRRCSLTSPNFIHHRQTVHHQVSLNERAHLNTLLLLPGPRILIIEQIWSESGCQKYVSKTQSNLGLFTSITYGRPWIMSNNSSNSFTDSAGGGAGLNLR